MIAFTFFSITPLTHTQAITTIPWHSLTARRPHFFSSTKESTQHLKNASSKLIHSTHWFELVLFPSALAAFCSRGHGEEGESNRKRDKSNDKSRDVKGGEVMGWSCQQKLNSEVKSQSSMEANRWIWSEGKKGERKTELESSDTQVHSPRGFHPTLLESSTFAWRCQAENSQRLENPVRGWEEMDAPLASSRKGIEPHQVSRKTHTRLQFSLTTVISLHPETRVRWRGSSTVLGVVR